MSKVSPSQQQKHKRELLARKADLEGELYNIDARLDEIKQAESDYETGWTDSAGTIIRAMLDAGWKVQIYRGGGGLAWCFEKSTMHAFNPAVGTHRCIAIAAQQACLSAKEPIPECCHVSTIPENAGS